MNNLFQSLPSLFINKRLIYEHNENKVCYMVRDGEVVTDLEGNLVSEQTDEDKVELSKRLRESTQSAAQKLPKIATVCQKVQRKLSDALPLMQLVQQLKVNQTKVADLDTDLTLTSHQKELEESKLELKEETLHAMSQQAERFAAWEVALEKRIELTAVQVHTLLQDRQRLTEEAVKDKKRLEAFQSSLGGARDRLSAFRRRKQKTDPKSAEKKTEKSHFQVRFEENEQRNTQSQTVNQTLLSQMELVGEVSEADIAAWSELDQEALQVRLKEKLQAEGGVLQAFEKEKNTFMAQKTSLEEEVARLALAAEDVEKKWLTLKDDSSDITNGLAEQQSLLKKIVDNLREFTELLTLIQDVRSSISQAEEQIVTGIAAYQVLDMPESVFIKFKKSIESDNQDFAQALVENLYQDWMARLQKILDIYGVTDWTTEKYRKQAGEFLAAAKLRQDKEFSLETAQKNPLQAVNEFFGVNKEKKAQLADQLLDFPENDFVLLVQNLIELFASAIAIAKTKITDENDRGPINVLAENAVPELLEAMEGICGNVEDVQGWFTEQIRAAADQGRLELEHKPFDKVQADELLAELSGLNKDCVEKVVFPFLSLLVRPEEMEVLHSIQTGSTVKISFGEAVKEPNIFTIKGIVQADSEDKKSAAKAYLTDTTPDLDNPLIDKGGLLAKMNDIVDLIRNGQLDQLSVKVDKVS